MTITISEVRRTGMDTRGAGPETAGGYTISVSTSEQRHPHFDHSLYKRWVAANEMIREKGIETYYEKARRRPRYGG